MLRDIRDTESLTALLAMWSQNWDYSLTDLPEETFALEASLNDYVIGEPSLTNLNQQASILLHHDAITGTNTEVTKRDYFSRISKIKNGVKSV